ncbi:MAG TPA: DUF308 domain-containing protein [Ignavibacteria bacterium]|nr:DUF308 domain-containing protein [Ignavibacteria bacterium]
MLETIQKHWWVLALRGILAIIFGIIAIASPGIVLVTLVFYFGFVAVFSGIFLIIEGIATKEGDRGFKMLYFIAFWAIMAGVFQIFHAIKLRKVIENEWLAILNGVITLVFGIMILFNVVAGAQALIMIFGFFAIISGVLMILLSFRVKSLNKKV